MNEIYLTCVDGPHRNKTYAVPLDVTTIRIPCWNSTKMEYVGDSLYCRHQESGSYYLKYLGHDQSNFWPKEELL